MAGFGKHFPADGRNSAKAWKRKPKLGYSVAEQRRTRKEIAS
jgi:hypothetical protein